MMTEKKGKTIIHPRGRPPAGGATKTAISFRVHPGLLESVQRIAEAKGLPYQTFMHEILTEEVSRIVNYERSSERQKVGLLLYQLDRIVEQLQRDCPSFALHAQELEDLAESLGEDVLSQIRKEAEAVAGEQQAS